MRAQLEVLNLPDSPCYTIAASEFLVLGRGRNADIVLDNDSAISRLHCKIYCVKRQFWIEDLGSRNHTVINNTPVRKHPLTHGDRIRIGGYRLRFSIVDHSTVEEEDEEVLFERLHRQDKLVSKIAIHLGFLKREQVEKCLHLQRQIAEEGPFIDLEQILLEEGFITAEQLKQVYKHKTDIPFLIPGYKLQELIGFGGMGRIYKARAEDGEIVAVKILSDVPQEQKLDIGQKFVKEAKAIAKLDHPNIVAGLDFGFSGKNIYIVMEYVDGPTLQQEVKNRGGRLLPDKVLKIAVGLARALEHAAERGLVHRDIKPENVLINHDGVVKLCDFGLVKEVGREENEGQVFGTPAYMSPEQCRWADIDIRSDIYSLGVLLYRVLFGRLPFTGTAVEIQKQHLGKTLRFPSEGQHPQKMQLAKVIRKMMAKTPDERYQTPTELLTALEQLAGVFERREIDLTEEVSISSDGGKSFAPYGTTEMRPTPRRSADTRMSLGPPTKRFRKIIAFLALFSISIAVTVTGAKWYHRQTMIQSDYQKVLGAIDNKSIGEAEALYKQYLQKYPGSARAKQLRRELLKSLRQRAESIYLDKQVAEARALCSKVIELGGDEDIVAEARAFLAKIVREDKFRQQRRAFWELWEKTGFLAENRQFSQAQGNVEKLRREAKTPEQQEALQRLEKQLQESIERQKLAVFRYYPSLELNLVDLSPPPLPVVDQEIQQLLPHRQIIAKNAGVTGVFFTANEGILYCIDAQTGNVKWYRDIGGAFQFIPLWDYEKTQDMGRVESVLVSIEGGREMWLLSITGAVLWGTTLPAKASSNPILYDKKIFVNCEDRHCYQILSYNGKILGAFRAGGIARHFATIDKDSRRLFINCDDGYQYRFTLDTGTIEQRLTIPQNTIAAPLSLASFWIQWIARGKETVALLYDDKLSPVAKEYAVIGQLCTPPIVRGDTVVWKTDEAIALLHFRDALQPNFVVIRDGQRGFIQFWQDRLVVVAENMRIYRHTALALELVKEIPLAIEEDALAPPQQTQTTIFVQHRLPTGGFLGSAFAVAEEDREKLLWQKKISPLATYTLSKDGKIWLADEAGGLYRLTPGSWQIESYSIPNVVLDASSYLFTFSDKKKREWLFSLSGHQANLLQPHTGRVVRKWDLAKKSTIWQGASRYSSNLLFITQGETIEVLSPTSGKRRYKSYKAPGKPFATKPMLWKRSLIVATEDGDIFRLLFAKKRKSRYLRRGWRLSLAAEIHATPIISADTLYLGADNGTMHAVNLGKKSIVWRYRAQGSIRSTPLIHQKALYFGDEAGYAHAVTPEGRKLWQQKLTGAIQLAPVALDRIVYFVTTAGYCYALDAENGEIMRKQQLGRAAICLLFTHKYKIYAGTTDGFLYILPTM